jgi:hypothetical protein
MENGNKQKEQHVLFLEATDLQHVSGKAVPRQLMLVRCFQEQNMLLLLLVTVLHTVILILMASRK